MAVYTQGKLVGVVSFKQIFPNVEMPALENLLNGLSRVWAVRLISNIHNKLVGKPFYNPEYKGEKTSQIDVPRFFFGPDNEKVLYDVISRYNVYLTEERMDGALPMVCAAGDETPLIMLKYIMAMPESQASDDIPYLEKSLFVAFKVANGITMNREFGDSPYKQISDLELNIASLLMTRYAYNDFTNIKSDLDNQMRNQLSRTVSFFKFVSKHPLLKDLYEEFLREYKLQSWGNYLKTYWSLQVLANYNTGFVNFKILEDKDNLLSEPVVEKDSIDIHQIIPLSENVDYVAFREKPFIKIAPHEYAIIDVSFLINRMYDGLYFSFNKLWQNKHPDNKNEFNRIFTTEFSEETVLVNNLKDVANTQRWFSLTDKECKDLISEHKIPSPPDFYIRDGKNIILFECKDVKIRKDIKENGTIELLLKEINKGFVGYEDEKKKWKYKGVGQLVRNAKRIQDGNFRWDPEVDSESKIFLVLVVADPKQVAPGWKNYLNRKMQEECVRQNVNMSRIYPLILTDLGTIALYKHNFKGKGLIQYFNQYFQKTKFDAKVLSSLSDEDKMTAIMNQTMSFSSYMNGEKIMNGEEFGKSILNAMVEQTS